MNSKNKCLLCGKTIVAVGKSRKNGKNHDDWDTRQYHKKCYQQCCKNKKKDIEMYNFIQRGKFYRNEITEDEYYASLK